MSDLREKLEAARTEYESIRYSGNLAADVLKPQSHLVRRLFISAAAMGALAAAVALWMTIQPMALKNAAQVVTVTPTPKLVPTTSTTEEPFAISVPEVPTFPTGIQLMPSDESMFSLPSVPTFPTLAELEREAETTSTATTKEAVL